MEKEKKESLINIGLIQENINNMKDNKYINDLTEDQSDSAKNGDVQIIEAGEKEKCEDYAKSGNQSNEYYKK